MADKLITKDIANPRPISFNDQTRSVRVVAVTENPVLMRSRDYYYYQITLVNGVQLPPSGQVPLLDCHNYLSVSSVLGSARNFQAIGDKLECDVFFSGTPLGIETSQKVKEGHLTDFSVGFVPIEYLWVPEGSSKIINGRTFIGPIHVITKWDLLELSIAPIGKDRQAKVRIWDPDMMEQQHVPDEFKGTLIDNPPPVTSEPEQTPNLLSPESETGVTEPEQTIVHSESEQDENCGSVLTQSEEIIGSSYDTPVEAHVSDNPFNNKKIIFYVIIGLIVLALLQDYIK